MATKKLKNELVSGNRSQAEELVISLLLSKIKNLQIKRNDKSVLGRQEIDIHLPQYKIAIEVDGICHHKPVYGQETFERVQAADKKKTDKLNELGYTLYRIDISKHTQATLYPYLKQVVLETLVPNIKLLML